MRSAWVYPEATALDGILGRVRLQCRYVHVVGAGEEWDIYPHSHDAVEFCCVLSGQGSYSTPGDTLRAEAGDFFVSPPGDVHWETREPGHPFELAFLNMGVEGEGADELLGFLGSIRGRVGFNDEGIRRQALDAVTRVSEEALGQGPGFISLLESHLLTLCVLLWRNAFGLGEVEGHPVGSRGVGNRTPVDRMESIKRWIWGNLSSEMSLESVAQAFFYHPKYLSGLFRRETGTTFSEWVQRERVQRVKELLGNTAQSMGSIAERTGFSSIPHMYRRFKAEMGVTPAQYRERMRVREGADGG